MLWATPNYVGRLYQEMDSFFNRYMGPSGTSGEFPPVNIYSGDDELVLTSDLPGIDINTLDISCKGKALTIKGERKIPELEKEQTYLKQERAFGRFVRSFTLPYEVNHDKIQAQYKNGVLLIKLPQAESEKPKRIEVSAG